jgi:two-component system, cell cycle sensor histidine kinase and response regulator CckA
MSGQPRSTILVVDTDENARKLISTTLADANFVVLEARGGMEGVATMLHYEGEIALAVVEIKMPGINGLDLANQIGIERPATEILYVSNLTNSVAVESITRAKPDAVLAKPFTPEQLLDRVQHCVPRKSARSKLI